MLLLQFPLSFLQTDIGIYFFIVHLLIIHMLIEMVAMTIKEMVASDDTFELGASADASEFWEWVQTGIDVYVPHGKYFLIHGFQLLVLLP